MNLNDVTVARISGEPYGYAHSLRLTVDIRIEESGRGECETTDHRMVNSPDTFALSWGIWRGSAMVAGGQSDPATFDVVKYLNGMDAAKLAGLVALHKRYHLNTMNAGCVHQDNGTYPEATHYACPQTGYKYGHAWLVEELPAGFMAALEACLPNV